VIARARGCCPDGPRRPGHGVDATRKRAVVAVAHKILVAIYHMLSHQVRYNELWDLYLDKLNKHNLTRNLVHRLERLGYKVMCVRPAIILRKK